MGYGNSGTFTQSGGTNTDSNALAVGLSTGSNSSYTLSGGTLFTGSEAVGIYGNGTFTQNGGTNNVSSSSNNFELGYANGSNGSYTLSGTGTLAAFREYVGYGGSGTFTQNGGLNLAGGGVSVAYNSGSSGTYDLNGGTLQTPSVTGGSGQSTFNFNGGTLQASTASTAFLSGLGAANVLAGGARIDTNSYSITIAQPLLTGVSGGTDGGLTKLGAGTLTLSGANTYTGLTTVSAGTLLARNTAGSATGSGAVQIQSGGTLGGNGTIAGAVTVQNGGILAPGPAFGELTLDSNLALNRGSTLAIELGGLTAGTQYDQVQLAGALELGGDLSVAVVNGFRLAVGQTFVLLDDTGTLATSGVFANATADGLYTDAAGDTFIIHYDADADHDGVNNDVTLTVVGQVPEPGTWALLGVGIVAVGWCRSRRCRRTPSAGVI